MEFSTSLDDMEYSYKQILQLTTEWYKKQKKEKRIKGIRHRRKHYSSFN